LYTEGRHPKDIVRSFAHEMIHHIQNLEGRLGNITTTNTQEDDALNDIEAEANLKGTMTFRNWTDTLNENIFKKSLDQTEKEALELVDKNWDEFGGKECNNGFCDIFAKNLSKYLPGSKIMSTEDPRNETFGHVWVEYNGNYFDAETPNGVSSWKELPWMKEFYYKVGSYPTDIETLNEAIVGNKIECDNCGWSWEMEDSGKDPYICHKCGHGNSPIEEKENKDPFGLNAYALELARGLEEELDKDEKNENVAPNHDGKAAPYGSGYKKINEGRYDTLANQLSKIAFQEFKDIHDRGDKEGTFKFRVDHPDEEHDIPADEFYFDFEGIVKITDDEYNVDGGANVGFDDKGDEITPILSVKFKIPKNPDWQKVSFDIKDVVRHELEHLTQDGDNEKGGAWHEDPRLRRPSKYMQDDQFLRDLIDVNLLPKSDYFKLEKEVDAMLQGMYFKAKKSKTPFKNVLNDYLDIFVDQGSISKEEKENILDVWRSRRKALSLPSF